MREGENTRKSNKSLPCALLPAVCVIVLSVTMASSERRPPCPARCICDVTEGAVNCNHTNRTNIPSDLPAYTKLLNLADNSISHISAYSFNKLSHLQEIDLSSNQIGADGISVDSFSGIKSLMSLDLSHNRLAEAPSTCQVTLPACTSTKTLTSHR